jgi:hypothetical protein
MKFSFEKNTKEERPDYELFDDKDERKEVFEYSKRISEYLRSEKIADLIIIDRSSRPLYIGVREYLKAKYPEEKLPGIYFMNPKGFKAKEELSQSEIDEIIQDCVWKDDLVEFPRQVRSKEEILEELENTYKDLMKDKEKPVLVFDTCIHSGDSLSPVKQTLLDSGFSDIKIGAINPSDSNSKVSTDFYITRERPEKGCYPFDRDRIIEKTFDHVYSKRTEDPRKREKSLQLRREIKSIMNDFMEKK